VSRFWPPTLNLDHDLPDQRPMPFLDTPQYIEFGTFDIDLDQVNMADAELIEYR
jgi:hypothetical protein